MRKQYFKELIKYPNKVQLTLYRQASHKARNIIKKRKTVNFNEFIDSLDPNSNSKNFWKVIKLFRNFEFFSKDSSHHKQNGTGGKFAIRYERFFL